MTICFGSLNTPTHYVVNRASGQAVHARHLAHRRATSDGLNDLSIALSDTLSPRLAAALAPAGLDKREPALRLPAVQILALYAIHAAGDLEDLGMI